LAHQQKGLLNAIFRKNQLYYDREKQAQTMSVNLNK